MSRHTKDIIQFIGNKMFVNGVMVKEYANNKYRWQMMAQVVIYGKKYLFKQLEETVKEIKCLCCNGTGILEDFDGNESGCHTCNGRGKF